MLTRAISMMTLLEVRAKDFKEDTHLIITSLGVPLPPFHLKNRILQAINPGFF